MQFLCVTALSCSAAVLLRCWIVALLHCCIVAWWINFWTSEKLLYYCAVELCCIAALLLDGLIAGFLNCCVTAQLSSVALLHCCIVAWWFNCWTSELLCYCAVELLRYRIAALLNCWIAVLLRCWASCWIAELLRGSAVACCVVVFFWRCRRTFLIMLNVLRTLRPCNASRPWPISSLPPAFFAIPEFIRLLRSPKTQSKPPKKKYTTDLF